MRTKPIPVTAVKMRQQYEAPKAMTVARTAMRMTADPCERWSFSDATKAGGAKSDDSYEDGGFEVSKTMTVTQMATPRGSHF